MRGSRAGAIRTQPFQSFPSEKSNEWGLCSSSVHFLVCNSIFTGYLPCPSQETVILKADRRFPSCTVVFQAYVPYNNVVVTTAWSTLILVLSFIGPSWVRVRVRVSDF